MGKDNLLMKGNVDGIITRLSMFCKNFLPIGTKILDFASQQKHISCQQSILSIPIELGNRDNTYFLQPIPNTSGLPSEQTNNPFS